MESASELYTSCIVCENELIEEKINVFADMIYHINMLVKKFPDSDYLEAAVSFYYAYSMHFMEELQREHSIYKTMIDFFESYEFITDIEDPEVLETMSRIFEKLEECMEQRIVYYASFLNRFDEIISYPVLTNNSFYIPDFMETLSEEDTSEVVNYFLTRKK